VLEGEQELALLAGQVGRAVGPGVQVAGAAQRLPEVAAALLAHVVDDDDPELMVRESARSQPRSKEMSAALFSRGVQAHQGIEHEEARLDPADGLDELGAVIEVVEAQLGVSMRWRSSASRRT
jgi:hypothetical protein